MSIIPVSSANRDTGGKESAISLELRVVVII